MNILSEGQATARQLRLPYSAILTDLSTEFVDALQGAGAFVEYSQQAIVATGEMIEYVSCIVAGRVRMSRLDADYGKAHVARLGPGEWFGERNLFVRVPAREEIYADGEVVLWTISPDTLRNFFFEQTEGVQLLYNIAAHLAERVPPQSLTLK